MQLNRTTLAAVIAALMMLLVTALFVNAEGTATSFGATTTPLDSGTAASPTPFSGSSASPPPAAVSSIFGNKLQALNQPATIQSQPEPANAANSRSIRDLMADQKQANWNGRPVFDGLSSSRKSQGSISGKVPKTYEEPSSIEQAMSDNSGSSTLKAPQKSIFPQLTQFGYSYFSNDSQGFAPLSDIPVGPDYVIGSGDRFSLTLWGSIDGSYELEVSRNGEIILPKIGPVKVSGISYGRLPALLRGQFAKVFKDFQLNVTMAKLRLIKVYLVGQVKSPGDYSLSSLSTLINALTAAGGPTKNGTLRNIIISRDGKIVETVDLYGFFLKGDKSRDIRLQNGDSVYVPAIGPVAAITGTVRRPAIYELKGESSLKDLIALADGIVSTGYLQRLQISRVEPHDKKIVTDVNLTPKTDGKSLEEQSAAITIRDLDLVRIFPIDSTLRDYARLEGHVLRPGDYALKPGMRLSQLLQPDNILPETNMEVGELTRLIPPDLHPEKVRFSPGKALAGDPDNDLELKEFDQIRIFSRWDLEEMPMVRISGEVQKPGDFRLMNNMRVLDLLVSAGFPKKTAFLNDAEITRLKKTSTSVSSYPISINLAQALKGDPQHNILLEPFDEITIRRIPNWSDETERYITLKGEFNFPGSYPIYKGERLSSVIKRAGGFSEHAYLRAAKFTRASVRELQQKRMDEFVASTEQEVNRKTAELASTATSAEELQSAKAVLEGVRSNLQLLKAAKAEGRMVLKLSASDKFAASAYDLEVMGGDVLEVPQRTNSVSVLGRVFNPTSFVSLEDRPVEYYLDNAGGPTRDSEDSEIYVVRADGSVFSRQQYSSFGELLGAGFLGEPVDSGDTIVVPQRFERTAWLRNIKDITTIMSQIALTAGTVLLGLK